MPRAVRRPLHARRVSRAGRARSPLSRRRRRRAAYHPATADGYGGRAPPLRVCRVTPRSDAATRRRTRRARAAARLHRLPVVRLRSAGMVERRGSTAPLSVVCEVPGYSGDGRVYTVYRGSMREAWAGPRTAADADALQQRAHTLLRHRTGHGRVGVTQAAEILLLARWFRLRPEELNRTWRVQPAPGRSSTDSCGSFTPRSAAAPPREPTRRRASVLPPMA